MTSTMQLFQFERRNYLCQWVVVSYIWCPFNKIRQMIPDMNEGSDNFRVRACSTIPDPNIEFVWNGPGIVTRRIHASNS